MGNAPNMRVDANGGWSGGPIGSKISFVKNVVDWARVGKFALNYALPAAASVGRSYEGLNNLKQQNATLVQPVQVDQNGGMQTDPLMDQLNAQLDQYHLGTLVGLEHSPTFHIDRDGAFTSVDKPGHTSFKGALPGASNIYIHPSAFEGQFKLFLVTGHELIHATHISDGSFGNWLDAYPQNPNIASYISEYRAYQWQAHQESILGVNYGAASKLVKYRNLLPAGYLNR